MRTKEIYTVRSNQPIARNVYRMELNGNPAPVNRPGSFVSIALEGFYLRRPISVCDVDDKGFTIIYKVVGEGTGVMAGYGPGRELDILTGLGNGFDLSKSGKKPLLAGGGVGAPPMYLLCRRLLEAGASPRVALGFGSGSEVILEEDFKRLGVEVRLATVDGSRGIKGYITDAIRDMEYDYFYACGPLPMLRALGQETTTSGQMSFEERMGCGFGACVGCSIQTRSGAKRVCRDGPVFEKEEILWRTPE